MRVCTLRSVHTRICYLAGILHSFLAVMGWSVAHTSATPDASICRDALILCQVVGCQSSRRGYAEQILASDPIRTGSYGCGTF